MEGKGLDGVRRKSHSAAVIDGINSTIYVGDSIVRKIHSTIEVKKVESYLPAGNVFGGIWRSFSGAAY